MNKLSAKHVTKTNVTKTIFVLVSFAGAILAGAADFPATLAELNTAYATPVGENAADIFLRGAATLQITSNDWNSYSLPWIGHMPSPPLGEPLHESVSNAVTQFLIRNESALQYFLEGASIQESRYRVDFNAGAEALMPHLGKLHESAEYLAVCALSAASRGQPSRAADALGVGFGLARSLEKEPALVSQTARARIILLVLEGLEQVLSRVHLGSQQLRHLQDRISTLESLESAGTAFSRGIAGDRLLALSIFQLPIPSQLALMTNTSASLVPPEGISLAEGAYRRDLDREATEALYAPVLAYWAEPYPQRLHLVAQVCDQRSQTARQEKLLVELVEARRIRHAIAMECRAVAGLRMALAAIALEQCREKKHRYPYSLTDLVPDFMAAEPESPCSGVRIKYSRTGDGYTLAAACEHSDDPVPLSFRMLAAQSRQLP